MRAHLLLSPRQESAPLLHVAVPMDERGRGAIGIPWATYSEAALILLNTERTGAPATYSLLARPDPTFPFELASLSAEAQDGDVLLSWETRSENGLFGWIVYRSDRPGGKTLRVNEILVPAIGDGDGPVSYQYLDGGVVRGRTYRYRVVGITHDGLPQESSEVPVDLNR